MPGEDGDFLEINDLQNNMHEQHLLQPQGEVYILNPLEEEPMQIANEEMQLEVPIQVGPPASPVNLFYEEIPLDQLMGPGDEGFPDQPEQPEQIVGDIQIIDDQQPQGPKE